MGKNRQGTDPLFSDKVKWLANQIFAASPRDLTGLKFYDLGCGCIYYQRDLPDGSLDPQIGIYRHAERGPCEICMRDDATWKKRSLDEMIVFSNTRNLAQEGSAGKGGMTHG